MFVCYLCESNTTYVSKFCDDCRVIKNIGNAYGFTEIKEILERTCLRDKTQIQRKINIENKDPINKNCYSPACNTRSKKNEDKKE